MRGTIGIRLQNTTTFSNATTRRTLVPFSTSSSGGGGGGRGRGGPPSGPGSFNFNERAPGKPNSSESKFDTPDSTVPHGYGRGHGRGSPIHPPSGLPSFSSIISSINQPPAGRGRGTGPVAFKPEHDSQPPTPSPEKPISFKREDGGVSQTTSSLPPKKPSFTKSEDDFSPTARTNDNENDRSLPGSIIGVLSGLGRGKPMKQADPKAQVMEENRHRRSRRVPAADSASETAVPDRKPIRSREDAMNNARKILSQAEGDGSGTGRGLAERGGFGRGRGRGRGRGGFGRDNDDRAGQFQDSEDAAGLYAAGDDADGEKLAKKVGPEIMKQLTEGFEDAASRVLPSPWEDEYVEALDYNNAIEFEPEYLMGDFDRNPDIDEKEPIPLRDALEKMKPFLMAYEGIQSQAEWEEIMEETMARVPLLKKIVDHYSGPDRVTAKQQQEELERVAKTLPQSAPSSVKQFTNRAVISLQSNPGWGFDKKCHFMDKLVFEVSQHYK